MTERFLPHLIREHIMVDLHTRYGIRPFSPKLEYRIKTVLTPFRKFIIHVNRERKHTQAVPLSKRLIAWRFGFTSLSYSLYELDRHDPRQYLRDFADLDYRLHTPGASSVNDKLNFSRVLGLCNLSCPHIVALIDRGFLLFQDQDPPQTGLRTWIVSLLKTHRKVVFKPAFGGAGLELFFLQRKRNEYEINGIPASLDDICSLLKASRYCLATTFIRQADYAKRIFPPVTNTVRLLTVWDTEKNTPFIAAAAHRFGSMRSFPMDNFHAGRGGLSASVGLESGMLGQAVTLTGSGRVCRYDRHPETGERIKGLTVPHWNEIKNAVVAAAFQFAASPYVGWDLVVTEEGCTFLEGNSPPGTAVWQAHAPLLRDPCVKAFFARQGML